MSAQPYDDDSTALALHPSPATCTLLVLLAGNLADRQFPIPYRDFAAFHITSHRIKLASYHAYDRGRYESMLVRVAKQPSVCLDEYEVPTASGYTSGGKAERAQQLPRRKPWSPGCRILLIIGTVNRCEYLRGGTYVWHPGWYRAIEP
ncbi:hypothetical protein TsFJ059_007251 [Trichoderma semiorbis]|uniref:Uncharacterized protein n=1 Tax=Trichoderma semiorbis TaxID=1491008 RepID=A0A9P8KN81_9HYPO|nr:hypothetical protein TsFJ059_007251 [Trichoderma semiorbis]